jgi:hypothetical protein
MAKPNSCCDVFEAKLHQAGYVLSPKCLIMDGISVITGLVLFVIGSMGAAGVFPGHATGWLAIGLGGTSYVFLLAAGRSLKERKFELIASGFITLGMIAMGILGTTGIISTTQVGWGIVGFGLMKVPVYLIGHYL